MSPRKVRRVLDLVRGQRVEAALALLGAVAAISAREVAKVLRSAAANAQNNHAMNREELWVCEAYADQGPTLKRMRRASMGRGRLIRRRTSHITLVVGDEAELASGAAGRGRSRAGAS